MSQCARARGASQKKARNFVSRYQEGESLAAGKIPRIVI
jgi:hypothetical protein